MSELTFKIEKRGDVNVLVWTDDGLPGLRPASTAEVNAWEAIQSLQSRLAAAEREREKWKSETERHIYMLDTASRALAEAREMLGKAKEALESVNRSIENGEGINVNVVQEALALLGKEK